MNMISTGTFLNGMDASKKQSELVSKLVSAWEKKNTKAARAGGVSLMALSLAACGDDDTTPFAQSDIDAATAPLTAAVAAAETALAAAQADAAGALVAQAAAETQAAEALVAQAAAEASAAAATVSAAEATAAAAAATAAQATAEAAQAAAEAALATANAEKATLQASYDALVASNATLQASYDALIAPKSSDYTASATPDVLIGGEGADTFTGTATTYNNADQVVDSKAGDGDVANITFTGSMTPNIKGVENVNITIASVNGTNPQITASSLTGVEVLTVTGTDVTVGGSPIAGDKDVDITGLSSAGVAKVVTGAGTKAVTIVQATKAGVVIDASTATGAIAITGAADLDADLAASTVAFTALGDATEDAKAVTVDAAKATSVTTPVGMTGAITINAAAANTVDVDNATGGLVLNAAVAGEQTTSAAGIRVGNIDASGATITTGTYASTAAGLIELEGTTTGTGDIATVSAGGTVTLKSAADNANTDQIETLNLSGNGAAVTYTLTGTPSTINITGSQNVTIKGNESSFDGKVLTDTSSGTSTVDITTLNDSDLSGIAADVIKVSSAAASKTLTVASGATVDLAKDVDTALDIAGKTAKATVTIRTADDTAASGATIDITTAAFDADTNITTVNLIADTGKFTATGSTFANAAGSVVNITGSKAVDLGTVDGGKTIAGGNMTGKLTATMNGANTATTITSGSGGDALTLNQAVVFTVETNGGNDTVTMSAASGTSSVGTGTGNDTVHVDAAASYVIVTGAGNDTVSIGTNTANDSDSIIVMGEGTADKLTIVDANGNDFSNNANFSYTGIETMDISSLTSGNITISAAQFAGDNTFSLVGNSAAVDQLVINGTDTVNDTIDMSGVTVTTASVTMGGGKGTDTITGGASNDTVTFSFGGDAIDGGAGTDTLTAATGIQGASAGTGSANAAGVVVNLGTTALAETDLQVIGGFLGGSATSVASGTANLVYAANSTYNFSEFHTIQSIENVTGTAGTDYIVSSGAGGTIIGLAGIDYIKSSANADVIQVNKTAIAGSVKDYDHIKSFTTTSDDIQALDSSFAFKNGASNGVVVLATGANLDAAHTASANFTVATISTNVATHTFVTFLAGTSSAAELEGAAGTAMGTATNANFANTDKFLVAVDDGTHTGVFHVESAADGNAIAAAEMSLVAVLEGVSDATALVAGDFVFA